MNNKDFKLHVKKTFLSPKGSFRYNKKDGQLHIKINTDISRFEPWIAEVNSIKKIKNSMVLSSGCGSGGDLYYFLKYSPKKVYRIETTNDLANLAKARLSNFNPKKYQIDIYDGNLLPYKNNMFDIIFSMHVLEHTQNPYLYLTELIRVTKNNGIIYIELPNKFYPIEQHTGQKYIHWLPKNLRTNLNKIGIIKTKYNLDHFLYPNQILRFFKKNKNITLKETTLHSYDNDNTQYRGSVFPLNKAFGKTTIKFVVQKNN